MLSRIIEEAYFQLNEDSEYKKPEDWLFKSKGSPGSIDGAGLVGGANIKATEAFLGGKKYKELGSSLLNSFKDNPYAWKSTGLGAGVGAAAGAGIGAGTGLVLNTLGAVTGFNDFGDILSNSVDDIGTGMEIGGTLGALGGAGAGLMTSPTTTKEFGKTGLKMAKDKIFG